MQSEALSGMSEVARADEERRRKNEALEQADKQMKTASTVGGATSGALIGAQYGSAAGPWGIAIGAIIGGAAGYLSTEL